MRDGRPSLTAQVTAAVRAALSVRGPVADPYAKLFVQFPASLLVRLVRTPARSLPLLRDLVGNVGGRTILFDEQLQQAVDAGISQVVVLGAGYDSRAIRFCRDNVQFIEVDLARMQDLKRRVLQRAKVDMSAVKMLAVDFADECLAERLETVLDCSEPCLFLWEGVVEYLPEDAVRRTLRDLRRMAVGASRLVFDLPHAAAECSPLIDFVNRTLSRALGEPKGFSIESGRLDEFLRVEGWRLQDKFEVTDLYERHLTTVLRRAPTPHNYYAVAVPD